MSIRERIERAFAGILFTTATVLVMGGTVAAMLQGPVGVA